MKAKTTTLVLAFGDGALIIGGSYLLVKFEGTSPNYVFAQVKVSSGLLENNLLPTVTKEENINQRTTEKEDNDKHGSGESNFTTAKKKRIHLGIEFHSFHHHYCLLEGEIIYLMGIFITDN